MTARCIECSAQYDFKNSRGAKLSERRCGCGGRYEIMSMNVPPVQVENPIEGIDIGPDKYVYPRKNKAGKLFLFSRLIKKYVEFTLPSNSTTP